MVRWYGGTVVRWYGGTVVRLYGCMVVRLYGRTSKFFCIIMGLCSASSVINGYQRLIHICS